MMDTLDRLDSIRIEYLPSPREIDEACASIRKTWTLSERRRRFVGHELPDDLPIAWKPPVADTSALRLAVSRGRID